MGNAGFWVWFVHPFGNVSSFMGKVTRHGWALHRAGVNSWSLPSYLLVFWKSWKHRDAKRASEVFLLGNVFLKE